MYSLLFIDCVKKKQEKKNKKRKKKRKKEKKEKNKQLTKERICTISDQDSPNISWLVLTINFG